MTEETLMFVELTNTELLDRIAEATFEHEELDKWLKAARRELTQRMVDEDIKSLKTTAGRGCTLSEPQLKVGVTNDNRDEFIQWLDYIGEGASARRTVTAPAVAKIVQHMIENSQDLPQWVEDKVKFVQNITIRKGSR